jgi:hypothetical protein
VRLREAYIDVLSTLRTTMRESLALTQQLPAATAEAERRGYAGNLAAWLEASPMTSASMAGSTSLGPADAAAAQRWETELAAWYADVTAALPTLNQTPGVVAGVSDRLLAGMRRSFLTVDSSGPSGTTGLREISNPAMIASRRALETALQAGAAAAPPRQLITSAFTPPALLADDEMEARLAAPGNRRAQTVDVSNVPNSERLSVRWAAWHVLGWTFNSPSVTLRNAWWPVVINVRRGTGAGATIVRVRYEMVFDAAGNVRPERAGDVAPTELPPGFAALSVPDKKAQLVATFGLGGVDDGSAAWGPTELDQLHGSLSRLAGPSRAAVAGVSFVRDHVAPANTAIAPGFTVSGVTHTTADPAYDGASPAHPPPHIHLYDNAFTTADLKFSGAPGAGGGGVDLIVAHEVGHMVIAHPEMRASAALSRAHAALSAMNRTIPRTAVPAWNRWVHASDDAVVQIRAYQSAVSSGSANVGGRHGQQDVAVPRATAAAAVAARNTARAALARAGIPLRMRTAARDIDRAADSLLVTVEQVPIFVALATRFGFNRFTSYAEAQNTDEDWFAEAHALFVTDPDRLFGMNQSMFLWFQAGMPMDAAWNPPAPASPAVPPAAPPAVPPAAPPAPVP